MAVHGKIPLTRCGSTEIHIGYERHSSDDENRTFYPGCAGVQYFNATELRMIRIGMIQTASNRPTRSSLTTEQRQRERYVLKEADESKNLELCW